jgi:hypothetical protein
MNNLTLLHIRASRFLSERYRQRERPGYFIDLFLWALIVIVAIWLLFALLGAMEMLR